MEIQVVTNIVIAVFGALIGLLLMVIGYFLVRLITQVDNTSKIVGNLAIAVDKLTAVIEAIQKESAIRYTELQNRLDEQHIEIEMLRTSRHKMLGYITAIKLQGQIKNGWEFKSSEWELPGIVPEDKK